MTTPSYMASTESSRAKARPPIRPRPHLAPAKKPKKKSHKLQEIQDFATATAIAPRVDPVPSGDTPSVAPDALSAGSILVEERDVEPQPETGLSTVFASGSLPSDTVAPYMGLIAAVKEFQSTHRIGASFSDLSIIADSIEAAAEGEAFLGAADYIRMGSDDVGPMGIANEVKDGLLKIKSPFQQACNAVLKFDQNRTRAQERLTSESQDSPQSASKSVSAKVRDGLKAGTKLIEDICTLAKSILNTLKTVLSNFAKEASDSIPFLGLISAIMKLANRWLNFFDIRRVRRDLAKQRDALKADLEHAKLGFESCISDDDKRKVRNRLDGYLKLDLKQNTATRQQFLSLHKLVSGNGGQDPDFSRYSAVPAFKEKQNELIWSLERYEISRAFAYTNQKTGNRSNFDMFAETAALGGEFSKFIGTLTGAAPAALAGAAMKGAAATAKASRPLVRQAKFGLREFSAKGHYGSTMLNKFIGAGKTAADKEQIRRGVADSVFNTIAQLPDVSEQRQGVYLSQMQQNFAAAELNWDVWAKKTERDPQKGYLELIKGQATHG